MNDTQILDYVLEDLEHSPINSALLRINLANMIKKFRDEEQKVTVEDRLKKLEAELLTIEKGFNFEIDKLRIGHGTDKQGEYVEIEVTALGGVYTNRVYANALEDSEATEKCGYANTN